MNQQSKLFIKATYRVLSLDFVQRKWTQMTTMFSVLDELKACDFAILLDICELFRNY